MPGCRTHIPRNPQHIIPSQIEKIVDLASSGRSADIKWTTLRQSDDSSLVIAIKCFRKQHSSGLKIHELQALINEELLIWKLLNDCPNVVDLFGVIEDLTDQLHGYLPPHPVSICYNEKTLGTLILTSYREFDSARRLQLLENIIRGVAYIHSKKIIHGDLRATNVVIDDKNGCIIPKICDFGSSHSNCDTCYKGSKEKPRSFQWLSPEICGGDGTATTESDIWAFGCLALEVQFGETPYHVNEMQAMTMREDEPLRPPATKGCIKDVVDLGVDWTANCVWNIMQGCWEQNPIARPDAQRVLGSLSKISANITEMVHRPEF